MSKKRIVILGGGTGGTTSSSSSSTTRESGSDAGRLRPQVEDIISVGEFYEKASGGQIIFT